MRTLVTGGVRSGKSAHAESLLSHSTGVAYIAAGSARDGDADWAARVAAHQARRPSHWRTIEATDLAAALATVPASSAALIDSVGSWLAALIDRLDGWEQPTAELRRPVLAEVEAAIAAFPAEVVLVTDEVGLGGVAEHRSARVFADLIGEVNQRIAAACDEVHLVVAGRVLRL